MTTPHGTTVCNNSQCVSQCDSGYALCGGQCIDTSSNKQNCGELRNQMLDEQHVRWRSMPDWAPLRRRRASPRGDAPTRVDQYGASKSLLDPDLVPFRLRWLAGDGRTRGPGSDLLR